MYLAGSARAIHDFGFAPVLIVMAIVFLGTFAYRYWRRNQQR